MFVFDMSIDQNFASFQCEDQNLIVLVDSFGDGTFSVRLGSSLSSSHIGDITATCDKELNEKLKDLVDSSL